MPLKTSAKRMAKRFHAGRSLVLLIARLFLSFINTSVFDTTSPDIRAADGTCAGAHHGHLTPPRISPSRPHCVIRKNGLWLGGSIIVG